MGVVDGENLMWESEMNTWDNRALSTGIYEDIEESGSFRCKVCGNFFARWGLYPSHLERWSTNEPWETHGANVRPFVVLLSLTEHSNLHGWEARLTSGLMFCGSRCGHGTKDRQAKAVPHFVGRWHYGEPCRKYWPTAWALWPCRPLGFFAAVCQLRAWYHRGTQASVFGKASGSFNVVMKSGVGHTEKDFQGISL